MSSLGRRPRLRRPCLPAVNRFQFALDIWLDTELLVALAPKLLMFWEDAMRCDAMCGGVIKVQVQVQVVLTGCPSAGIAIWSAPKPPCRLIP